MFYLYLIHITFGECFNPSAFHYFLFIILYLFILYLIKNDFVLQDGKVIPIGVKVGDKVLLPEYGGTKIVLEEQVKICESICVLYSIMFQELKVVEFQFI